MDAPTGKSVNKDQADNPLAEIRPPKVPKLYTLGEYLQREERSKERHEYFNGVIKPMPMVNGAQNIIVVNIISALKTALKTTKKRHVVLGGRQIVYISIHNFGLYPDVLVVCEKPEYHDDGELLLTNPLLIVEILSKSTRHFDIHQKFSHYKTLSSFKEYVLIEQDKPQVETWYREEPDLWRNTTVSDPASAVALRSVSCEIGMSDIYEHIEF